MKAGGRRKAGDTAAEARTHLQEALALFFETASAEEIANRWRNEVYVTQWRARARL